MGKCVPFVVGASLALLSGCPSARTVECPGSSPNDMVRMAVATGSITARGFTVSGSDFDLAFLPGDIDRDGDGLANGIDPAP